LGEVGGFDICGLIWYIGVYRFWEIKKIEERA
jgi:hypothetical protein